MGSIGGSSVLSSGRRRAAWPMQVAVNILAQTVLFRVKEGTRKTAPRRRTAGAHGKRRLNNDKDMKREKESSKMQQSRCFAGGKQ